MSRSPFATRGVAEAFYGLFYTFPERNDLIRFIGRHGYNLYIYGPKNDRQHRARWWEPYPDEVMGQFAETAALARRAGVTFCYALAPISATSTDDLDRITAKLRAFYERGVRSFSLFLDDIAGPVQEGAQRLIYHPFAQLHVELGNRVHDWLRALDPACTLSFCPAEYHGAPPFGAYLHELGARLHPAIDLFYTGPAICSTTIAAADARGFAAAAGRPPLIWDNYPVNDLAMRGDLHVGPIQGRDAALGGAARGLVVNTMSQAEASKIALLTFAEYFADPAGYAPWPAWGRALREVGGEHSCAALRQFAEHSLRSCLHPAAAPALDRLVGRSMAALCAGEPPSRSAALHELSAHIERQDEANYALKHRMANLALRAELTPWIEALDDWVWLAKRAILVLQALERGAPYGQPLRGLEESIELVRSHHKRIAGDALLELADYARKTAAQGAAAAETESGAKGAGATISNINLSNHR
ncbi:MAG: beta-N-acetylglucosaminidase domain-containing protein [Kouleothrix sp.]|nr:beta-N-acetylglucosaminidase domain-containing protein [Kouleothrix sp.]